MIGLSAIGQAVASRRRDPSSPGSHQAALPTSTKTRRPMMPIESTVHRSGRRCRRPPSIRRPLRHRCGCCRRPSPGSRRPGRRRPLPPRSARRSRARVRHHVADMNAVLKPEEAARIGALPRPRPRSPASRDTVRSSACRPRRLSETAIPVKRPARRRSHSTLPAWRRVPAVSVTLARAVPIRMSWHGYPH